MGGQQRVWKIYGGAGVWGDLEQRVWKERGGVSQHSPGTDMVTEWEMDWLELYSLCELELSPDLASWVSLDKPVPVGVSQPLREK